MNDNTFINTIIYYRGHKFPAIYSNGDLGALREKALQAAAINHPVQEQIINAVAAVFERFEAGTL